MISTLAWIIRCGTIVFFALPSHFSCTSLSCIAFSSSLLLLLSSFFLVIMITSFSLFSFVGSVKLSISTSTEENCRCVLGFETFLTCFFRIYRSFVLLQISDLRSNHRGDKSIVWSETKNWGDAQGCSSMDLMPLSNCGSAVSHNLIQTWITTIGRSQVSVC